MVRTIKFLFLYTLFLILNCHPPINCHGFESRTYVKIFDIYKAYDYSSEKYINKTIEGWQIIGGIYETSIGDLRAKSYAADSLVSSYEKIKMAGKSHVNCYIKISFIAQESSYEYVNYINCSPTQEFFVVETKKWVPACLITPGDVLYCENSSGATVINVEFIKSPIDLYMIEVEKTHTFCVSSSSILTHNIPIPAGFMLSFAISFGEGAAAGGTAGSFLGPVTIGIGILGGGIVGAAYVFMTKDPSKAEYRIELDANKLEAQFRDKSNRDSSGSNQQSRNNSYNGSNPNLEDPDDEEDRKKGDAYTTNKQDQKDAETLGYKRDKNPPFDPQNKHAFRKGQTWITGDRTGHKGGRWKMFNNQGRRIGTFDKDLKRIIGN